MFKLINKKIMTILISYFLLILRYVDLLQLVKRLSVLYVTLLEIYMNSCFVQVVVIITMVTVSTHLSRSIQLSELAGNVQIVRSVRCVGKYSLRREFL